MKTNEAGSTDDTRQVHLAQMFAQVTAVLMRDPAYRDLLLAELEWLVLPPLLAGQARLGHSVPPQGDALPPQHGLAVPTALAMWACVSPEVDARLSAHPDEPLRLRPAEWVSGGIPWLMVVAGHPQVLPGFLKLLIEREFKGQSVKMRLRQANGRFGAYSPTETGRPGARHLPDLGGLVE